MDIGKKNNNYHHHITKNYLHITSLLRILAAMKNEQIIEIKSTHKVELKKYAYQEWNNEKSTHKWNFLNMYLLIKFLN